MDFLLLLYVIEHWFSIRRTCVKWGTYISLDILTCRVDATRRGVLSPYLFAIYIDSVTKAVIDLYIFHNSYNFCADGCRFFLFRPTV